MAVGRVLVDKKASDPSGSMHLQSPAPQPHRQGGLWSFLTWSFFLSQVVAAENFIGARAHAESEADGPRGADSSIPQTPGNAGQPLLAAHVNRLDDVAAAPPATSQPQGEHSHAHDGSFAHDGVVGAQVPVGGHIAAGALPVDSAGQGVEDQAASQPINLSTDAEGSPAATVDIATLPATGAVGDALSQIVSPVLGTLDNTMGSLDAILDHALASGTSLATPIANVADTLLQSAAAVVDQAVAPISDVLSVQGVVASPGTIVLSEVPLAGALGLDDLFSKGTYTAYNLNLNSEPVGASVSLQTGGAAVSIVDNIIGDPHGVDTGHDGHDNTLTPHTLPTSALDELHLRGLGEAVSLV